MGNEDTLVTFPVKLIVPLLLKTLADSDSVLASHACRALIYMMEALPRSCGVIAASGISAFLAKLQACGECGVEVAEQALTALESLSRRYSKQILSAPGAIGACLAYIDFFSIGAQRSALHITANCCQNMVKEEFVHVQASLAGLAQRLLHSDKKSVECVCTLFARLVETFQREASILREIASHGVLANMQQLILQHQPAASVVSSAMLVTILHTVYLMCVNCNELAVDLLESGVA